MNTAHLRVAMRRVTTMAVSWMNRIADYMHRVNELVSKAPDHGIKLSVALYLSRYHTPVLELGGCD